MSTDYALTRLMRNTVGRLAGTTMGRKTRQIYTRLMPVKRAVVRNVAIRAILPLHQVGTFNEFSQWERREPSVLDWLDSFVEPFTFVDVGANFGTESLYVALKYPQGRVIACDPELLGSYNLAVNIRLNDIVNIDNYVVALADKCGWLSVPENVNYLYPFGARKYATAAKIIRTETLDSLLQTPVHYLKVDVDGLEGAILSGGTRILADRALRSLIVEVDDAQSRPGIRDMLGGFGFSERQRANAEPNNLLFVRE